MAILIIHQLSLFPEIQIAVEEEKKKGITVSKMIEWIRWGGGGACIDFELTSGGRVSISN